MAHNIYTGRDGPVLACSTADWEFRGSNPTQEFVWAQEIIFSEATLIERYLC